MSIPANHGVVTRRPAPGSAGTGARRATLSGAWPLIALLTALNVLNFVDRQLLPSLAPLIIAELHLTRADIGLLVGFTFVIFYTVVGVGLGVAADRWPRRWLIAGGLALWSGMTAVSGAARSFVQLAVPRVLVGVGEATLTPAALSMLGDAVPPGRLALASSLYYAGLPVGTALSLAVAGWVAPRFGWRACFYALGVAGLAVVALVAAAREPARRRAAGAPPALPSIPTLAADAVRALAGRPALALAVLGSAALAYASAAAIHVTTWLVDERAFPFAAAAYTGGVMAISAGLLGNVASGWFADRCARRWTGGRMWSLVLMTLAFAPFSLGFYTLPPGSVLFYGCWFVSAASTTAYFGPVLAAVQELSPAHTRASTLAFALLVMNLGGVGPGSWITGLIGDRAGLTAGLVLSVAAGTLAVVPFAVSARLAPAGGLEA